MALMKRPVPKKTQVLPELSNVTELLAVTGPSGTGVPPIGTAVTISVGSNQPESITPQFNTEHGAVVQVPIVKRYILPVQYPSPVPQASYVDPSVHAAPPLIARPP